MHTVYKHVRLLTSVGTVSSGKFVAVVLSEKYLSELYEDGHHILQTKKVKIVAPNGVLVDGRSKD